MKWRSARTKWTREIDLSSGRRVTATLHPSLSWELQPDAIAVAPIGVVWFDRVALTEGEMLELRAILEQDELVRQMRGDGTLPPRLPFKTEVQA